MSDKSRGGCMAKFREGLYSVQIETCVITLTLVSVLAITGELLINMHIVQIPPQDSTNNGVSDNLSAVHSSTTKNNSGGNPIDPGGDNSTDPLQTAHLVFHYISLVIAAIFLTEIMLKILAKGKEFFLKIFQVADALIVLGAFALEVVFTVEQEELPLLEAATYIIILRLWRVPYVCNIKADELKKQLQREYQAWQNEKSKLKERCKDLEDQIRVLEKHAQKDKNANQGKKSEIWHKKEKNLKASLSNGHISHTTFTEINEENANHMTKSANRRSGGHICEDVNVDDDDVQESKKENCESQEHLNENGNIKDTNSAHTDISQDRGPFSRTDSESSLPCDPIEQEVVVQIEGPISPKKKLSNDDTASLIEDRPQKVNEEFSYSNAMFEDEIGHGDLPVLHEIDGVKTYRNVDGIPMTSL